MYAARNFFKAHNVSSHPMKDVNGSVEFLSKYTDSLIVCAVLEHFGMDDVDSEPTRNVYDKDTMEPTEYVRKQLNLIVDTFAIHEGPDFTAEPSKLVCPHCKKEYLQLQGLRKHMKNKHNSSGTAVQSSTGKEDSIFNYSCAALSMCLLWKDFEDARKHGDGERTIRLYKFLMLYFKLANKTKYTYHSLRLLAQVKCILSPKLSHQLIWNRCVNNVGHEDTNSEVDRENEHHNRVFKCECGHFHGKISDASVGRISHSAQACDRILRKCDKESHVRLQRGEHKSKDVSADVKKLAMHMKKECIFQEKIPRHHHGYPSFAKNPLTKLDLPALQQWMTSKLNEFAKH